MCSTTVYSLYWPGISEVCFMLCVLCIIYAGLEYIIERALNDCSSAYSSSPETHSPLLQPRNFLRRDSASAAALTRCAASFSCCCSRSAALRCCCRRRSRVPACRAAAARFAPSPQRHPRRRLSSRYLMGEGKPAAGASSVAGARSVAGGAAAAVAVGEAAGAAEGSPPCGRLLTHTHALASGALRSTSAPGGTRWASWRASLTSGEC